VGKFCTLIPYQNNEILDLELGSKCGKVKFSSNKEKYFEENDSPFPFYCVYDA
jgi:hypothetical protein